MSLAVLSFISVCRGTACPTLVSFLKYQSCLAPCRISTAPSPVIFLISSVLFMRYRVYGNKGQKKNHTSEYPGIKTAAYPQIPQGSFLGYDIQDNHQDAPHTSRRLSNRCILDPYVFLYGNHSLYRLRFLWGAAAYSKEIFLYTRGTKPYTRESNFYTRVNNPYTRGNNLYTRESKPYTREINPYTIENKYDTREKSFYTRVNKLYTRA